MKCPKCSQDNCQFVATTTGSDFNASGACCGYICLGPLGLLCGLGGNKKNVEYWMCNSCGTKFTAAEAQESDRREQQSEANRIMEEQQREEKAAVIAKIEALDSNPVEYKFIMDSNAEEIGTSVGINFKNYISENEVALVKCFGDEGVTGQASKNYNKTNSILYKILGDAKGLQSDEKIVVLYYNAASAKSIIITDKRILLDGTNVIDITKVDYICKRENIMIYKTVNEVAQLGGLDASVDQDALLKMLEITLTPNRTKKVVGNEQSVLVNKNNKYAFKMLDGSMVNYSGVTGKITVNYMSRTSMVKEPLHNLVTTENELYTAKAEVIEGKVDKMDSTLKEGAMKIGAKSKSLMSMAKKATGLNADHVLARYMGGVDILNMEINNIKDFYIDGEKLFYRASSPTDRLNKLYMVQVNGGRASELCISDKAVTAYYLANGKVYYVVKETSGYAIMSYEYGEKIFRKEYMVDGKVDELYVVGENVYALASQRLICMNQVGKVVANNVQALDIDDNGNVYYTNDTMVLKVDSTGVESIIGVYPAVVSVDVVDGILYLAQKVEKEVRYGIKISCNGAYI